MKTRYAEIPAYLTLDGSVIRELMQPAKAISEIKVLQLQGGMSGGANGDGANGGSMFGAASPILKTIMEAGAAYPLLREMLTFAQVDTGKLADKVRSFVGTLPDEVRAAVDADPELAKKLAEITRRVQDTTMAPVSEAELIPIDESANVGA